MKRLILSLCLLLISAVPVKAEEAQAPLVRIVSSSFVLPAKFRTLKVWAQEAGYRLDWRYADVTTDELGLEDASLIIIDGPRPSDRAAVEKAVGSFDKLSMPWIAIGGGPPGFGHMPPETARRLIGYYAGGGEANLRAFIAAVPLALNHASLDALPPPHPLPATGLYHPDAPAPFSNAEAFADWARGIGNFSIVAFAISEGQIRDMQTSVLKMLTKSAQERGLIPAFFWYDERDPKALTKVVQPLRAQALVNLTHMQNGDARKAEFEALDIPVLQGIADRSASPDQWRKATSGISGMSAAVMLSVPESWGVSDPVVLSAVDNGEPVPMPEQVNLLTAKLARLVALRTKKPQDKHIALFFWNYPVGEKNLAASNLNLPQSLAKLTHDLKVAGYDVREGDEQGIIAAGQAMLGGLYHPETLNGLASRGLAAKLPLATYTGWLSTLPPSVKEGIISCWGRPEDSPAVRDGAFLIPRLALGKLNILPQPPRGGGTAKAYHDIHTPPDHRYFATYLWARLQQAGGGQADAILHFGTHGTQEWTPGKDRGLWAYDAPFILLDDVPVFYPYVQDNVAEAVQARRRGRAVTISHQTPAFAPSGLYDELRDIHALIHQYAQLEAGSVRERVAADIVRQAHESHLDADMGWSNSAIAADFDGYYTALHDHLHQLARASIPLGLHIFGAPSTEEHRLTTVMQQLGPDYLAALGADPKEAFAEDFSAIEQGQPYRVLHRYLREGADIASIPDLALRKQIERAAVYDRNLAVPGETEALLAGLAGRFVRAGPGGDPVRTPDVPSGRNLYAFEAEKVPAPAAYEEGGRALDRLIEAYKAKHDGEMPKKLAFSTFSGDTIRTLGIGEGQILHALGLRPVWGRSGRVERLDIVPLTELGRPRIDVVMQPTSVYRDQFDAFMRLLADGIDRIAAMDEKSGPAANARVLERELVAQGMEKERARALSRLRIFTNAPGDYGTGLSGRIIKGGKGRADDWSNEKELADPFLRRMGHAYGARDWGLSLEGTNLFAEQLKGVDAAVLMRSSNVHGLVSTDHPFEHLGGLSLAIRSVSGKAPDLFVTDMRGAQARVSTAGAYLSDELRGRYLNPHWIGEMQKEGYAGANAMLGIVNNLWGWQVTDPSSVRADQWQAMHDTYVRDARNLGLDRFFERVHPNAQLQMVDRMIEAIRRDYWKPDDATRQSLEEKRAQMKVAAERAQENAEHTLTIRGFGMAPASSSTPALSVLPSSLQPDAIASQPKAAPSAPPMGRILVRQISAAPASSESLRGQLPALAVVLLLFLMGALIEMRRYYPLMFRKAPHARA